MRHWEEQKILVTICGLADFELLNLLMSQEGVACRNRKSANLPAETECYGALRMNTISKHRPYVRHVNWWVHSSFVFLSYNQAQLLPNVPVLEFWTVSERLGLEIWLLRAFKATIVQLYNNQINARALIGQSAVGYCAGKPTETWRVFWIII